MDKKRIQPAGMANSPAFSQGIEISGFSSVLVIGGQNAVDGGGNIVGPGAFGLQCRQALSNVRSVLEEAGYAVSNVIKWTIYMVQGNDPRQGFMAFREVFDMVDMPPAITVLQVAGLASPDFLVEIEAVAVK